MKEFLRIIAVITVGVLLIMFSLKDKSGLFVFMGGVMTTGAGMMLLYYFIKGD